MLGKAPASAESSGDLFDPPREKPEPVTLSAGFNTLLNANRPASPSPGEPAETPRARTDLRVTLSLVAADVALIVVVVAYALATPPTFANRALCFLALGTGAWMSVLAAWRRFR